jgi:hypothetical protein
MGELERLFPLEIKSDGSKAKLRKSAVVKTPRSVYAAIPGRNKFRPSQVCIESPWVDLATTTTNTRAARRGTRAVRGRRQRCTSVPYTRTREREG